MAAKKTTKSPTTKTTRTKRTAATAKKKASPKKRATASSTSKKTASKQSASKRTKASKAGKEEIQIDRRHTAGRRTADQGEAVNETANPKLERRKKVQRRRQIDPTTCERDYSAEEVEFMNAMDDYKRKSGRMFPTCSEVLEVLHLIGYSKYSPTELAAARSANTTTEASAEQNGEAIGLADSEETCGGELPSFGDQPAEAAYHDTSACY